MLTAALIDESVLLPVYGLAVLAWVVVAVAGGRGDPPDGRGRRASRSGGRAFLAVLAVVQGGIHAAVVVLRLTGVTGPGSTVVGVVISTGATGCGAWLGLATLLACLPPASSPGSNRRHQAAAGDRSETVLAGPPWYAPAFGLAASAGLVVRFVMTTRGAFEDGTLDRLDYILDICLICVAGAFLLSSVRLAPMGGG